MAKNEGPALKLTLATIAINNLTDVSLTSGNEVVDCTSFDSSGDRDILMSTTSWSISATANIDGATAENFNEAFTTMNAKLAVAVTLTYISPITGDFLLAGSAFITELTNTGTIGDVITYSITLEGTGALTNTPSI